LKTACFLKRGEICESKYARVSVRVRAVPSCSEYSVYYT
jgi:hypothetical protein